MGRTGVAGLLIGNTAEKILGRIGCSVLTVKPAAFVSPVGVPADDGETSALPAGVAGA